MDSSATISHCQKHRYSLERIWNRRLPMIMFIGLNPSRADAVYNDPTITRCIRFACAWGFGGMYFANLYSFRTPYVTQAQVDAAPDGNTEGWEALLTNLHIANNLETDNHLQKMISLCDKVVCAWGSWKFIEERSKAVLSLISDPHCFGVNKDGHPKHPLYLAGTTELQIFKPITI